MDKGKVIRLILIPVLIGLVVTVVVRQFLTTTAKPVAAAPEEMVSVVAVAGKEPIPARTKLSEAQLVMKPMPRSVLTGLEFTSIKDVAGSSTVIELEPGEVLLPNRLVADGKGTLPFRIPTGTRAVTIHIDEMSGVAGFPEPGDLVDLVLFIPAKAPERPQATARLLYEAVPVLAKGPAQGTTGTPGSSGKAASATPPPAESTRITSLTIALKPEAATEVALAEQIGVIKVLLRPALSEPNAGRIITSDALYK